MERASGLVPRKGKESSSSLIGLGEGGEGREEEGRMSEMAWEERVEVVSPSTSYPHLLLYLQM